MTWLVALAGLIAIAVVALAVLRVRDRRADREAWTTLIERAGPAHGRFDPESVASLPEPVQRYFRFMIRPGAPLHRVVEIDMHGELGLGTKIDPRYRPMSARQLLAPPHGLLWRLASDAIRGSDGVTSERSWTRFWLFGVLPVVRAGGEDHRRSAFGRVVAEGAFWVPASLLPGEAVRWEVLDDDRARAIVTFAGFEQAVTLTIADDGRPTRVVIQRWSDANPERVFREQSFGGELSGFRAFGDYRLPTIVDGGNHIGTADYFPFYRARVDAIRFPAADVAP